MTLRFGYGTNGFTNHRLEDALEVLAGLGYAGVALTLDHAHLDPFAPALAQRVAATGRLLERFNLGVVIETGARYLLDPWRKHAPTLLDDDAHQRVRFLKLAIEIADDLGAEAVSFWSGVATVGGQIAWDRLRKGCAEVIDAADRRGVWLGFEPEPGMLVATIADYHRLRDDLGQPPRFGLTLDIGHCQAIEPAPVAECVRQAGPDLVHVQIEDMRRGVHEHLPFGAGEIDFPPVLRALCDVSYRGLVAVELPRHCHAAPELAVQSIGFLKDCHGLAL